MVLVTKRNGSRARRTSKVQIRIDIGFRAFVVLTVGACVLIITNAPERRKRLRNAHWNPGPAGLFASLRRSLSEEEKLQLILQAKVNLVDLTWNHTKVHEESRGAEYQGVYGKFCKVEWGLQKNTPDLYPFYYDLIASSPDCLNPIEMDLRKVVPAAVAFDSMPDAKTKSLNFTAAVFQESRCGANVVADVLAVYDPGKVRVYSESPPAFSAMSFICGHEYEFCPKETAVAMLQDVVYLMGRTDDFHEERSYFKIQGTGALNLDVFQEAFPETPWLFLYRNPVQILQSHFEYHSTTEPVCLHGKKYPSKALHRMAEHHGAGSDARKLSDEDYCAAYIATIAEAGVQRLNQHAIPIDYSELPDRLTTEVLPSILGKPLTSTQLDNLQDIVTRYSTGGHGKNGELTPGEDGKQKEKEASDEIKIAAVTYLEESYNILKARTKKAAAMA